jgi:hypothetical protein
VLSSGLKIPADMLKIIAFLIRQRAVRRTASLSLLPLLLCAPHASAQRSALVCNTLDSSDCRTIDTSIMGGIRFEDYRVTNPKATFITPGLRTQELTALGPGLSAQLCVANPIAPDIANPPTISYVNAQTSIVEANYSNNGAAVSEEILVSQFNVFSTSDGFSSPSFGLKVSRVRGQQIVQIAFIPGNPGLQNIPGFVNSALVQYDPVADSVVGDPGPFPSSIPLRRATIAVAMKVRRKRCHGDSRLNGAISLECG